jgi:hypothetical protein
VASLIVSQSGDVTLKAPTISLAAGIDTAAYHSTHTDKIAGISASVGGAAGNVLGNVQTIASHLPAADRTKDSKAKTLYQVAAAMQAVQGAENLYNALASGDPVQSFSLVDIKVGFGASSSKSEAWGESQRASGGQVLAGGKLHIVAGEDLTLKGATAQGSEVVLTAGRDLNLQSLALVDTAGSKNTSTSGFAGFVFAVGAQGVGLGVTGNVAHSAGNGLTTTVTHALIAVP